MYNEIWMIPICKYLNDSFPANFPRNFVKCDYHKWVTEKFTFLPTFMRELQWVVNAKYLLIIDCKFDSPFTPLNSNLVAWHVNPNKQLFTKPEIWGTQWESNTLTMVC